MACGSLVEYAVGTSYLKAFYAFETAVGSVFVVEMQQNLIAVDLHLKGTLDLPGGFVDMDETVEEGMRREIQEETGIHATKMEYLFSFPNQYLYSGITVHTIDMDFLVRVPAETRARAADDAAECMWIPIRHLHPKEFGLTSIRRAVERFLEVARIE